MNEIGASMSGCKLLWTGHVCAACSRIVRSSAASVAGNRTVTGSRPMRRVGGADGVEQASDGSIFVSSFELGAVWRMDAEGENLTVLVDHVGFQTTADFYLDEAAGKLYVPNTPAGSIMVLPMQ